MSSTSVAFITVGTHLWMALGAGGLGLGVWTVLQRIGAYGKDHSSSGSELCGEEAAGGRPQGEPAAPVTGQPLAETPLCRVCGTRRCESKGRRNGRTVYRDVCSSCRRVDRAVGQRRHGPWCAANGCGCERAEALAWGAHGTQEMYEAGCRCSRCSSAEAERETEPGYVG